MPSLAAAAAALLLALASAAAAAEEALDHDAVAAAPHSHEALFGNGEIRVPRVTIARGANEPVHEHRWPSIMIFEQAQPIAQASYELVSSQPVETVHAVSRQPR